MTQINNRAVLRMKRSLPAGISTRWIYTFTWENPVKLRNSSFSPLLGQVLRDEPLVPLSSEFLDSFSQFY